MGYTEGLKYAGLSPRLRGNQSGPGPHPHCRGSIPALAGEPSASGLVASTATVYPRACGGTIITSLVMAPCKGLSPRLRGNPTGQLTGPTLFRSIPALAGEPLHVCPDFVLVRVYPRACGGTRYPVASRICGRGLSPRLRGNRPLALRTGINPGVYPRACGGTKGKR